MDNKALNILFPIAILGLIIAGGIFLCISIFDGNATATSLPIALACILLSNLLNVLKVVKNKKK